MSLACRPSLLTAARTLLTRCGFFFWGRGTRGNSRPHVAGPQQLRHLLLGGPLFGFGLVAADRSRGPAMLGLREGKSEGVLWVSVNGFELQDSGVCAGGTMPRCRRLKAVESETSPVGSSPMGAACRWVEVLGRLVHVQRGVLGI